MRPTKRLHNPPRKDYSTPTLAKKSKNNRKPTRNSQPGSTRRSNVTSLIPAASGRVPESLRDNLEVNTIAPPDIVPRTAQQGPSRSNLAPKSAATDRGPSLRAVALSVAHGPVVNIVSDSGLKQTPVSFHQEAFQSICREQCQPVIGHPDNTRAETQTSPVANPAPVAQGPQNSNYGTFNLP